MAAHAQVHLQADAHATAKLKPKMLRKLFNSVVLAAVINGSVSLDVGVSRSSSYAV